MTVLARGQAAGAGAAGPTPASPRASRVCAVTRCPQRAIARGLCAAHRKTTSQRGYGLSHQAEREAALPGARCENCGCISHLQRDHRDPTLTGRLREAPGNKRWLCDCEGHRCHSRLGMRSSSRSQHVDTIADEPAAERDLMRII